MTLVKNVIIKMYYQISYQFYLDKTFIMYFIISEKKTLILVKTNLLLL